MTRTSPKKKQSSTCSKDASHRDMDTDVAINPPVSSDSSTGASTAALQLPSLASQHKHDSAPDLHSFQSSQEDSANNITLRFKRKFYEDSNSSNMEALMEQMKCMFATFSLEQASRFKELQSTVSKIEKQNNDISHCVEFLSQKYDDMMDKIKMIETDKKKDQLKIRDLEDKIEALERKNKDPVIEIKNLPLLISEDKKYDTRDDYCQVVKRIGNSVNIDIKDNDIKDIYSKKTQKNTQKIIVAEFATIAQKEKVLEAIRTFNKGKQNSDKLNSEHLGLKCLKFPVYVSEALTQKTQKLLADARKLAKDNNYIHCCTYRGSVHIKKVDKGKYIKINNEEDLVNIKNKD